MPARVASVGFQRELLARIEVVVAHAEGAAVQPVANVGHWAKSRGVAVFIEVVAVGGGAVPVAENRVS